jgi:hypothetical protein
MSSSDKSSKSLVGLMQGSVLRYDDPFEPAIDPMEWEALGEASGLPLREGYIVSGTNPADLCSDLGTFGVKNSDGTP